MSAQLFPHGSPSLCLMAVQLSIPQLSETTRHLSAVLNQDAASRLNGTTQDASSATLTAQLTLSGQTTAGFTTSVRDGRIGDSVYTSFTFQNGTEPSLNASCWNGYSAKRPICATGATKTSCTIVWGDFSLVLSEGY